MTSLKGQLLVATPDLFAQVFTHSVILMLEHSEGGAAGVIVNRPTEGTIADVAERVFDEPSDWGKTIGLGGPVPGPLILLHTVEDLGDQEVIPGLFNTVDPAKLRELVGRKVEPSLALANYSGWAAGQLEGEIESGSWIWFPASLDLVFWEGARELWDAVTKLYNARRLSEILRLRGAPDDPRVN
jgi:putative transcriptional regulator